MSVSISTPAPYTVLHDHECRRCRQVFGCDRPECTDPQLRSAVCVVACDVKAPLSFRSLPVRRMVRCHGDGIKSKQRKFAAGHVSQLRAGTRFIERRRGDELTTHCQPCAREFFGFEEVA